MLNLDKNQKYLLACSHGPDSMALLYMLKEEGYNFAVAHVNYHLREEADQEQAQLEKYCAKNDIPIHVYEVDELLNQSNLEEQCRVLRYSFFKELVSKYGYYAVLIAHNEDDVIETYLMQKRRQNLVEFYGIKENPIIFDIRVIRPLLGFTKHELLMFCSLNGIEYSIDKTNLENVFLRNQIRHEIVEKMNKDERKRILAEMSEDNRKLAEINERISRIDSDKCEDYNRLSDDEFLYALVALGRRLDPAFTISRLQGLEVRKIFASDKANVTVEISGLKLVKSYDSFQFIFDKEVPDYSYVLEAPGKLDNEYFFLDFSGDTSNRHITLDDYPLTIRNAKPEDEYLISDYTKQLRRLFIDWKMPVTLRKRWPVIVNKEGKIVYVPRYQKDFVIEKDCNFYVK